MRLKWVIMGLSLVSIALWINPAKGELTPNEELGKFIFFDIDLSINHN